MGYKCLALAVASALRIGDAAHWAVIMAGSNQYYNYRHQTDACHAYQIAKKHGIPESNIILLAYDDIANDPSNPFPGKLFNHPNGTDVYAGCKISYKGTDVTAANFLKVLTGDTTAKGPVLKSTAADRVFVYFTDHGGPGILGVPEGCGDYIHAADVNAALMTMNQKKMYKEVLFYIEACESGSIFAGLLKAPNVKAVTASNPDESSWGWYCPPDDVVQGKEVGSCLGDEFSVAWMEDADAADFTKETVEVQFQQVKNRTTKSHVTEYGIKTEDGEPIGRFEGDLSVPQPNIIIALGGGSTGVDSRDVELRSAYFAVERAKDQTARAAAEKQLEKMLFSRRVADDGYTKIARLATKGDVAKATQMLEGSITEIRHPECHRQTVFEAKRACGMDSYAMRYSRLFVNLCEEYTAEEISHAIQGVCNKELVV